MFNAFYRWFLIIVGEFDAPNALISCFVLKRAPRVKKSQKQAKKGQTGPNREDDTA